jgi:tetratricopeptide (TPR) repeat protein
MSWLLLAAALTPPPDAKALPQNLSGNKLPITGLAPAKYFRGLCIVTYPVSTNSPECQKFFDQGLGYTYSYVWMEAARSFETAARCDPECALAWWGLSRALDRYPGHGDANKAAQKAYDLRDKASHREQQLILARMQEKGLLPGVGDPEKRRKLAIATIDNMIELYDDDEEAWFYRAQLDGGAILFGGSASSVPFYKALWRINPLHPGANHELLHYAERCQRPALGWIYAENYIKSSPGIPHPFHMQAHLAMRLGRWDKTSNRSAHAIELERAYHKDMKVAPKDDPQFDHHMEVLTRSLIHDGRFAECRAIKKEASAAGLHHWEQWFRLHLAERDYGEALKIVEHFRKNDKLTAAYMAALVYLSQGDPDRATPEVETLQHAYASRKEDRKLEMRLWEVQGMLMCHTGGVDAGLKLLARAVEKTKNDFIYHAWGGGAYMMEVWGTEALHGDRLAVAEEAFLEALAHDPGSVRGALGMQVLCERQGRTEEARRFADVAHRCWNRADSHDFATALAAMRNPEFTTERQRTQRKDTAAGAIDTIQR